jgi:hypothetical protein
MTSAVRVVNRLWQTAALIALTWLLSSCETTDGRPLATTTAAQLEPGTHVVSGRLELYEDGTPTQMGLFASVNAAAFLAAPTGSDRGQLLDVDTNGTVNWKLPPGEYDLVALRLVHRNGSSLVQLKGHLTVSADQPVTEIGLIRAERGSYGSRVRLIDSANTSTPDARNEAALPQRPLQLLRDSIGSYARVVDVCAPRWWLQCTQSFNGVEAVSPKVDFTLSGPQPTRLDTLQPRFRWRTALTAGAAYDLVVWRGISYKPGALAATTYASGPVAFYAENLQQAEFAEVPPLQPKSHYFWSVRMRQADTVSTWTTTGHDTFLLVAWSRSSGHLFEFETP